MKKDQKNLFTNCHNGNFKKTSIFTVFFFSQISDIISDVITLIVRILKIFFDHFVYNITKYNCANYHVKSTFLTGFIQAGGGGGGHYVPPPPPRSTERKKSP